ncbi:response regulator [Paraburkholderia acidiphila]|uniref:Response regulator n=1 Tax=Paraburkholderia acidiphila TaxID=2571747 RepID=A0A7Z2JCD4_9BURK|nr:response regulator [Paraburkholderia acidiphila]
MANVLIVDDDQRLLEANAAFLASAGHTVRCAGDGEHALRLARAERIDIVLTDYTMPVMDGLQLARAIDLDPVLSAIPVVLVSAVATPPARSSIRASLRKPFAGARLLELTARFALRRS